MRLMAVISCLNIAFIFTTCNGASAITDGGTYSAPGEFLVSEADHAKYNAACPDYRHYSAFPQYVCLRSVS